MPRAITLQVDVGRQRHLAHMHLEDLLAADDVRIGHHDLAVEAAGAQQRRVEHVGPVGGGDEDDALVRLEAVHLDQQLVQRLLALVIAAAEAGAAMAADRVDLVDEDDAGRVLLRLLEHVAHARRADADEHLDEVGAGDGEERHVGLAGDGARQKRLAGAGRADQQHAARDAPAQPLELLRVAQELDDLLEVFLGLVDAGDVLEGDAAVRLGEQLRLRLAEAERLAAGPLHLAHEEDPHRQDEEHREPGDQHAEQRLAAFAGRLGGDRHALVFKLADQRRVLRRVGLEGRAVGIAAGDLLAGDDDAAHVALVDLADELRIGDIDACRPLSGVLEEVEQGDQDEPDDDPQGKIAEIGVHSRPFGSTGGSRRSPSKASGLLRKIGTGRYEANKTFISIVLELRQRERAAGHNPAEKSGKSGGWASLCPRIGQIGNVQTLGRTGKNPKSRHRDDAPAPFQGRQCGKGGTRLKAAAGAERTAPGLAESRHRQPGRRAAAGAHAEPAVPDDRRAGLQRDDLRPLPSDLPVDDESRRRARSTTQPASVRLKRPAGAAVIAAVSAASRSKRGG